MFTCPGVWRARTLLYTLRKTLQIHQIRTLPLTYIKQTLSNTPPPPQQNIAPRLPECWGRAVCLPRKAMHKMHPSTRDQPHPVHLRSDTCNEPPLIRQAHPNALNPLRRTLRTVSQSSCAHGAGSRGRLATHPVHPSHPSYQIRNAHSFKPPQIHPGTSKYVQAQIHRNIRPTAADATIEESPPRPRPAPSLHPVPFVPPYTSESLPRPIRAPVA